MKAQSPDSVSLRCAHRTAGGRQCRLLASDATSGLCPQHRAAQKHEQEDDHLFHLIREFQGFQTAQGINFSLGNLYELLAQNRISPRRAAVLAYVSSLMLRTLPQIDADVAAGIKYSDKPPAKPVSVPDSAPEKVAAPDSPSEPASASDANSPANPGSSNAWDPSLPEPDPNKKPS